MKINGEIIQGRFSSMSLLTVLLLFWLIGLPTSVLGEEEAADESQEYFDMELEDLLGVEISVVSKKVESTFDAPGVAMVIPRDEIDIYGDRTLQQIMDRQPSVYTRPSFVWSYNAAAFRGNLSTLAENHTLILLNGRPMRESALGYTYPIYMAFPVEMLNSVEIIRGPGSVLYGSRAFTGVINLKTKDVPDEGEVAVKTMTGCYDYYNTSISVGGHEGNLGMIGTFQGTGNRGWPYNWSDATGTPGSDNYYDKSISGVVHMDYKGFTFDLFAADIDVFSIGVVSLWSNPFHESNVTRIFANLGYRIPLQEQMDLEFNLTWNLQKDSLSGPAPIKIGTNTSDLLGEVTLYARPADNMNLVLGYLMEKLQNYEPDTDHYQSIRSYDQEPASAYAQFDYKIEDFVKFITGTQWNKSGQGVKDVICRYGIIITPWKNWGVKLLYGEAFRAPVALETDLYDPPILVGNDDLEPETVETYDAQLFYHNDTTYAALTYFDTNIDGLIIYDPTTAPPEADISYGNGGEQKFDGVEFEVKHFFTPNWHILGSYMYQDNDTPPELNPSVVPEYMIKCGTGYKWDWGTAGLFVTYYDTPPNIESSMPVNSEPDSVVLVSANFNIDISEWFGLEKGRSIFMLKGENLLDQTVQIPRLAYMEAPNSYPYNGGITFYTGLKFTF
ncbi:MAG: TonB-dependent receptor [Sedimentisphaerales bacterium]|nr:TonB-dependent receptor [Sedimentisphaerales bacterium]